ncbi:PilN domain-containing protein [uncultured Gimesia sp.]|mgnify:CR=1 FL=1|uniref:PilN domain-containing protein n=1 Tax=uncultured Gimesia sp. TaxID=1678688 RepID=UPI0030DA8AD6|tara:strand:+ start:130694 stop:131431 length:738 start_codon:yes stop_codon:yes gene_type:complete
MIPEIDFLPASYREVRRRHRNRIWRRTIVVIFLTLVTLGTVRQREIQHELQTKKKTLEDRVQLMHQQLEDPAQLNQKIKQAEIRANLLCGLQLDESPAQVLSIISSALPNYVSLNEFQFQFEKVFDRDQPPGKKIAVKTPDNTLPELVDLQNLQSLHAQEDLVIKLQGISPDHLSISNYMSNLDQMGMFKEIDLIQSNETIFEGQPMRAFRLRVVVNAPGTYVPRVNPRSSVGLDHPIAGGFSNE